MNKSFYNLDYIIELGERRLEECNSNYQNILGSITNIILIYSAFGIFLTSLFQHFVEQDIRDRFYYFVFIAFLSLFAYSIIYFVRLLIPVEIAYLNSPSKYYMESKLKMKLKYPVDQQKVDDSLKGSYILEINEAIDRNLKVFRNKRSFYYNALILALLAIAPYIVWVSFN